MQKPIVIADADEEQCQELCAILEREHFSTTALHSLVSLEKENQRVEPQMAILDLDTLSVEKILRCASSASPVGLFIRSWKRP